jgi:peptide/nickel transport system ATP-binding protein
MALLEVEDLRTYYSSPAGLVKAVDGVTFSLDKAETLGIAGESGCGKTTLVLTLMRLLPRSARVLGGRVTLDGFDFISASNDKLREMRWKEISMVFQGAMNALNPVMRIEDQIAETILIHEPVDKQAALQRSRKLLKRVGIDESRGREYPHQFSGGMRQRAMIAMALACNPSVLVADEPTTALDLIVQAQILQLLNGLRKEESLSIILITHDLGVISKLCDKVGIMYAGKMVEFGSKEQVLIKPSHPYTKGLLACVPSLRGTAKSLAFISGDPPQLVNVGPGCRFRARCPHARPECENDPPNVKVTSDTTVSCVLYK